MQHHSKPQILLAIITTATLAPFLNKAFYVDDPLFLWIAQQIIRHPLDPYGFEVNWSSFTQPMSAVMQNPPLCSYYIAAVGRCFGWNEPVLHLAFLFWAIMAVTGTFALARRFCLHPFSAALLTLFTPIFLVSGTTIMCDVMMLALWVWALEFWLAGLERMRWRRFLIASVLISVALLTKYFAIALIPLLAAYTLVRGRRFAIYLLFLLIPVAVISSYEWATEQKYGHALFGAAMGVSSSVSSATRPSQVAQLLIGLAFAGGCFVPAAFFTSLHRKRILLAAVTLFVLFAIAFKYLIVSWIYLEASEAVVCLEGGVFAAVGIGILELATANALRRQNADALLLMLWVFGTMAFAIWFNWSITSRTFLPMTPAVGILAVSRFEHNQRPAWLKYSLLLVAAMLAMSIAAADYCQARSARAATGLYQQRYAGEASNVRFLGHWGFQYYMEQWGAKPFDRQNPELVRGDVLLSSLSDPYLAQVLAHKTVSVDETGFGVLPFVATSRIGSGASFYSSFGGPLPWVINKIPSEHYVAAHIQ